MIRTANVLFAVLLSDFHRLGAMAIKIMQAMNSIPKAKLFQGIEIKKKIMDSNTKIFKRPRIIIMLQ